MGASAALGELADAYDDQRQDGPPYPTLEAILAAYDRRFAAAVANKSRGDLFASPDKVVLNVWRFQRPA